MTRAKPKHGLTIRMLTPDDAESYAELTSKTIPTSGVGDTPIFTIFSRGQPVDRAASAEKFRARNSLPLGFHGWARTWGAFTKDGSGKERMVGEVALVTSRLAPVQMHRVLVGISIDIDYRHVGLGTDLMRTMLRTF